MSVLLGTGYYLSGYWINFPFIDDYHTIVDFLIRTKRDSFAYSFGHTIWQPHNEHRVVFTRLVAVLYAYLSPDGVRFDVLSASGLLFRALILWSLHQEWKRTSANESTSTYWTVAGFMVVVLIITSGRDMENLLWATCALQNIPVVAWALLAFGAASRSRWRTAWLLGALATLTSGNGIFVLVLLSSERLINRQWLVGGVSLVVSVVVYGLYRNGINLPLDSIQWTTLLPKFFAFQGSFFYLHYYLKEYGVAYTLPTVLVGLLYTAVGLETIWSYHAKRLSLFYPAVFVFVWMTALPIAMIRPGALEGRFAIYSMILTGVVYARLTTYLQTYRPGWLRFMHPVGLIASCLFFAQSFVIHHRTVQRHYRTSLAAHYTFWHNDYAIYDQARQQFNQLRQAGLFSTVHIDKMAKREFGRDRYKVNLESALLNPCKRGYYSIHTVSESNFLILKHGKNQLVLPTDSHEDVPPFTTFLMPSWIPQGDYTVKIVNSKGIWPTNLSILSTEKQLRGSSAKH